MAITGGGSGNGLPTQIVDVLQQKNYLQRLIRRALKPTMVFRAAAKKDYFEGRIGESKTFTRRTLIAPNATPLNPAANTGLDNGMTADQRAYEQWTATLSEWSGFIPVDMPASETLLGDYYEDTVVALVQKAGASLDLVAMQRAIAAYDAGDTFITSAETTQTVIPVDNINGFTTQFSTTDAPSLGKPQPVTTTNKLPVLILDGSTGAFKAAANVQGYAADGTNTSIMQTGGNFLGTSGTLTLDAAVTVAKGDRIVAMDRSASTSAFNPLAKDGSLVVRPTASGVMRGTAYALTDTDVIVPSQMIPYAVSVLKRRGVPKLANGLYGCAIDSTLLSYFYQDDGFLKATATRWNQSPVFKDGVIAAGWGVEFTEATQVPVYLSPNGSFPLRHAFVFGEDVISEHPFTGFRDASDVVADVGDIADERYVDGIKIRTLAALDTLGKVIKVAYDYIGDFEPGTDKGSNPQTVFTSDYQRYKRGVLLQAAAQY